MSMTPEEPRRGTLCCGAKQFTTIVYLHRPGERPAAIGHFGTCGQCLKAARSFVPFKTDTSYNGLHCEKCPSEFDASAFARAQRAPSEFGRANVKFNDLGMIVPWGWTEDSRADFKKAAIPDDEVQF